MLFTDPLETHFRCQTSYVFSGKAGAAAASAAPAAPREPQEVRRQRQIPAMKNLEKKTWNLGVKMSDGNFGVQPTKMGIDGDWTMKINWI